MPYTQGMTHTQPVLDRYGTPIRIGALVQYVADAEALESNHYGRVVTIKADPPTVGVRWNIDVPSGAHAGDPQHLLVHLDNDEIAMHIRHTLGVAE
jgi:hypothetical protein